MSKQVLAISFIRVAHPTATQAHDAHTRIPPPRLPTGREPIKWLFFAATAGYAPSILHGGVSVQFQRVRQAAGERRYHLQRSRPADYSKLSSKVVLITGAASKTPALFTTLCSGTDYPAIINAVITAVKPAVLLPVLSMVIRLNGQNV